MLPCILSPPWKIFSPDEIFLQSPFACLDFIFLPFHNRLSTIILSSKSNTEITTWFCIVVCTLIWKRNVNAFPALHESHQMYETISQTARGPVLFSKKGLGYFLLGKTNHLPPNKQKQKPPCFCSPLPAKAWTGSASLRHAGNVCHEVSQGWFVLHVEMKYTE